MKKGNLYLVSIVGCVAIVALVVMVLNSTGFTAKTPNLGEGTSASTKTLDSTGQAIIAQIGTMGTCIDSDGGNINLTRGTTRIIDKRGKIVTEKNDTCTSSTMLTEYYCTKSTNARGTTNYLNGISISCSSGCTNGACFNSRAVCGNGVKESSEQCDDGNVINESCTYGSSSCTICSSSCTLVSGATIGRCGDNLIQSSYGEQCDGSNLNNQTCALQLGPSYVGSLSCNSCKLVTTGCIAGGLGNLKIISNPRGSTVFLDGVNKGVVPENTSLEINYISAGSHTLKLTKTGYVDYTTTVNIIATATTTVNYTLTSICGDGILTTSEQCDDGNVINESCTYGSSSCTICSSSCTLVSGATIGRCGDNLIQSSYGEQCDGSNLNNQTCALQLGTEYIGALTCNSACNGYNTTGCVAPPTQVCGNNIKEGTEQCDDGNTIATDSCNACALTPSDLRPTDIYVYEKNATVIHFRANIVNDGGMTSPGFNCYMGITGVAYPYNNHMSYSPGIASGGTGSCDFFSQIIPSGTYTMNVSYGTNPTETNWQNNYLQKTVSIQ